MKNIEKYYNELLNQQEERDCICYYNKHVRNESCADSPSCDSCATLFLKWLYKEYKPKLTNAEKVILSSLPEKYNYIARDDNGVLFVYEDKPKKCYHTWGGNTYYKSMELFSDLFKFIKWEDDEPYSIEELLKEDTYEPSR